MISAEPVKIKPEYLTPKPRPRYRTRYTRHRRKYTPRQSPTTTPIRSQPVTPASSPAVIPHKPKFNKPNKIATPAPTVERDWVKERLGRQ